MANLRFWYHNKAHQLRRRQMSITASKHEAHGSLFRSFTSHLEFICSKLSHNRSISNLNEWKAFGGLLAISRRQRGRIKSPSIQSIIGRRAAAAAAKKGIGEEERRGGEGGRECTICR